jgi:hypothetical protein
MTSAGLFWAGIALVLLGLRAYGQPRVADRVAYWHQTIAGLDETPAQFYAQVHQALREALQQHDIALVGFGFGPQRLFEGRSALSEQPLYLSVRYKHLTYYLYTGQTPAGLFISTWLYNKKMSGIGTHLTPFQLASLQFHYFGRQSLFQYDATLMFFESVHSVVLEVLDRYLEERKLQPLEEYERRPVLHAFYGGAGAFAPAPTNFVPGAPSPGQPAGKRPLPL